MLILNVERFKHTRTINSSCHYLFADIATIGYRGQVVGISSGRVNCTWYAH